MKPLRDGDVLTLLAISPQFANAVTLRGHVAQPLRYPYKPGMRIRDLIPDREALISPDFYRRKNLLVQIIEDEETLRLRRLERDADRDLQGNRRSTRDDRDSARLPATAATARRPDDDDLDCGARPARQRRPAQRSLRRRSAGRPIDANGNLQRDRGRIERDDDDRAVDEPPAQARRRRCSTS